jgi:predicted transcriptional regulator
MYYMNSMVRPVQTTRVVYVPHRLNGASCTSDKSCICGIVQKTHTVAIFGMKGYITSVQYN